MDLFLVIRGGVDVGVFFFLSTALFFRSWVFFPSRGVIFPGGGKAVRFRFLTLDWEGVPLFFWFTRVFLSEGDLCFFAIFF